MSKSTGKFPFDQESQHTPGPWSTGTDEDAHCVYADPESGTDLVADCGRDDGDAAREAANAQLCAAAPVMLLRLEQCLEVFQRWHEIGMHERATMELVRKAIWQAKGGAK